MLYTVGQFPEFLNGCFDFFFFLFCHLFEGRNWPSSSLSHSRRPISRTGVLMSTKTGGGVSGLTKVLYFDDKSLYKCNSVRRKFNQKEWDARNNGKEISCRYVDKCEYFL